MYKFIHRIFGFYVLLVSEADAVRLLNLLTEKRLLLAQRLLAQGASPSEAGEQTGYQDYSTFSRAYKKHFGRGPSADMVRKHDLQ
mgnify:CR=1 FL=1